MSDLDRLRTLCSVVSHGGITRAAAALGCAQSTLSAQIAALERDLGVRLFARLGGGVRLTDAGESLHASARQILQQWDQARLRVASLGARISGPLALGASSIPAAYILPRLIAAFRRVHADVAISVRTGNSREIIAAVESGDCATAIVGSAPRGGQLAATIVAEDRIVLALPPQHPWSGRERVPPAELAALDLIGREDGSGTMAAVLTALRQHDIAPPAPVVRLSGTAAVLQGVKAGLGAAFVSEFALGGSGLATVSLRGCQIQRSFHLIHRVTADRSPALGAWLDFLGDESFTPPRLG